MQVSRLAKESTQILNPRDGSLFARELPILRKAEANAVLVQELT
jgi:hypothetical protein